MTGFANSGRKVATGVLISSLPASMSWKAAIFSEEIRDLEIVNSHYVL
jgi:hypothetical protein